MTTYCTDADLLCYEPDLFRGAAGASQGLLSGTGDLAGTSFTIASGSFVEEGVEAWGVLALEGALAGCYPIVSVDGAGALTVSVLHPGLFPEDGSAPQASPIGAAAGVGYAVRSFWPQRRVVSELLARAAGLGEAAGATAPPAAALMNPAALRRACALGTLQLIYSALAAAAAEPGEAKLRSEMYGRLYRRALASARVELDTDGDGRADVVRVLGIVEMRRA